MRFGGRLSLAEISTLPQGSFEEGKVVGKVR